MVLMLLLLAAPISVTAEESVAVEVSFTVVNAPGNVVMKALDGAPAPSPDRFENTSGNSFRIEFTEPDDYYYQVYQESPGPNPEMEYDGVVYEVHVVVICEDDGSLSAVWEALIPGNAYKAMGIVFTNPPVPRIDKDQKINNGVRTKETLRGNPGDRLTYYITVTNGSDTAIYDVNVTDGIPDGLLLAVDSISDNGGEENGIITWNIGDISPASSKTVYFSAVVPNVNVLTKWTNVAVGTYADGPISVGRALTDDIVRHDLITNEVEAIYEPGETTTDPEETTSSAPEETTTAPTTNDPTSAGGNSSSPKTGDDSQLKLWLALMVISLLAILATMIVAVRKGKRN